MCGEVSGKKLFFFEKLINNFKLNILTCWILPAFGWKRCAMRSAVVLLSVAVGESVSRFDIVMALIGGSLTGSLVFVLPPLIYSRALILKGRSTQASTTEGKICVGSRKRFKSEEQRSTDSGAHSRSIYYGFLNATNNPHRYIRSCRYLDRTIYKPRN